MPKTKEELTQLKTECETIKSKLKELSDDELNQVCGGVIIGTYSNAISRDLGMSYTEALVYFAPFLQAYRTANPNNLLFANEFENILKNEGKMEGIVFLSYNFIIKGLIDFAKKNNFPDVAAKLQNIVYTSTNL